MKKNIKVVSNWFIFGFFSLFSLYTIFILFFVYKNGYFNLITKNTYGIIQPTFVTYLIGIFIFIILILLLFKRFKFIDLGVDLSKIKESVKFFLLLFIIIQVSIVLIELIYNQNFSFKFIFQNQKITYIIGTIVAQIFGVAFLEEVLFRGFLLPQIYNKVKAKSNFFKITVALIISQLIFAIWHIPVRLYSGMELIDIIINMFVLLLIGIVFALIYLRTNNLFIVMVFHAFNNAKITLIDSNYYNLLLIFISVVVIVFGSRLYDFKLKKA